MNMFNKKPIIMKKINFLKSKKPLVILLLISVFSITSCSKDESEETTLDEADVVEAIESSLVMETNGMSKTVETTAKTADEEGLYTETPTVACGETIINSYNEADTNGGYSYNYSLNSSNILTCTVNGYPDYFTYSATLTGIYNTPRMSSEDEFELTWTVTGLPPINSSIIFNGDYVREGTQVSKVLNMNTFSSALTFSLANVSVSKTTYQIESGTAHVSFVGVSSNGNQYTYSGILTFNGDGTATLILNGNTYIINL